MRQQLVAFIALAIAVVYLWRRIRPKGFTLLERGRLPAYSLSPAARFMSATTVLAKMWPVCIRYRRSLQRSQCTRHSSRALAKVPCTAALESCLPFQVRYRSSMNCSIRMTTRLAKEQAHHNVFPREAVVVASHGPVHCPGMSEAEDKSREDVTITPSCDFFWMV